MEEIKEKESINKDAIRLRTVRSIDQFVSNIIDTASRTALYNYDIEKDGWSKTDVEGTFMVYSRNVPPHNMITIINRLNKSNFVEPLTPNCDYQVKPPYLLFRTNGGTIYGIWFSEQDDVHRISQVSKVLMLFRESLLILNLILFVAILCK